jgi:general secretion pathway protein M
MQKLKEWFASLQARERLAVSVAAALISVMVIYVLGLAPIFRSVNAMEQSVATKKADLAWMRSNTSELQMLVMSQPQLAAPTGESLVVLIGRTAREAGLEQALTNQTPNGQTGIRVSLQDAAFDMLMVWLNGLQSSYGVTIESASINRAAQPGLVNVSLELNRTGA